MFFLSIHILYEKIIVLQYRRVDGRIGIADEPVQPQAQYAFVSENYKAVGLIEAVQREVALAELLPTFTLGEDELSGHVFDKV